MWVRSKKVISKIPFQKLSLIINGLEIEKCNLILISKKFRALRAFRGQIPGFYTGLNLITLFRPMNL